MTSLRTPEAKKRYEEYLQTVSLSETCPLCDKPALKEFTYWKIVENTFPYDLIAQTHNMVIPLRHMIEAELSDAEVQELKDIKGSYIETAYDYILECTNRNKSIPQHFHLHLLIGK